MSATKVSQFLSELRNHVASERADARREMIGETLDYFEGKAFAYDEVLGKINAFLDQSNLDDWTYGDYDDE